MTMMPRCRQRLAQVLCVLAVLMSFAGEHAGAAQTLKPVGLPLTLAGAGNSATGVTGIMPLAIAESAVDGSFELATLQPDNTFLQLDFDIEAVHYASNGQASAGVSPNQMLGSGANVTFPAVAALAGGGFVTAWVNTPPFFDILGGKQPIEPSAQPRTAGDVDTVAARLLDSTGQPMGTEIQVSPGSETAYQVQVAALSSGGFVATWSSGSDATVALSAELFDAAGEPLTREIPIASIGRMIGVTGLGDGGFVVAWGGVGGGGLFWQRFNAAGTALAPPVRVTFTDAGGPAFVAANPAGQVALSWMTTDPGVQPIGSVLVELFGIDGSALAAPVTVVSSNPLGSPMSNPVLGGLAVDLQGQALVAWSVNASGVTTPGRVQLVDATGATVGAPVQIGTSGSEVVQQVVAQSDGSWNVLWTDYVNAYVQTLSSASCSPSATSLCLDDNRFRFDVQFTNPLSGGGTETGNPVPLAADTGALWFFDPAVPELVAKVIDGTAVNGHFWVFFASLTNVEFDLTVTDTQTGAVRVYHNPAGTLASVADTAFPTAPPANPAAQAAAQPAAARRAMPAAAPGAVSSAATPALIVPSPVCNSTGQQLCLLGSQYAVTVTFDETAASPSTGQAVQLSADGGYYWFFGPDDAELAVKMLDGTAVNGHIWVFYASLTNVEFDLTITNISGATRKYHNAAGTLASVADTSAF
jgi:hypothetical protein